MLISSREGRLAVVRKRATWIMVIAWIVVPVAVASWVISQERSSVTQMSVPVWIPATATGDTVTHATTVVTVWEPANQIIAPAWAGLIQSVILSPGDDVSTGTPVLVVDGVTRLAVNSTIPFSRTLERGDTGPDVAALNAVLIALDRPASDGATFGAATAASITSLAVAIGAGETATFDPSWFLYLPVASGVAATLSLDIAAPVPPPGTTVVTLQQHLLAARAVPQEAVSSDGASSQTGSDADVSGGTQPPAIDPSQYYTDLPEGTTVRVGEQDLGSVATDGALGADALAALSALSSLGDTSSSAVIDGALVEPLPGGSTTVPADAVVTGPDGTMCVLIRGSPHPKPMHIVVIDSFIDESTITGVTPGTEVLIDPPATDRASCRSL